MSRFADFRNCAGKFPDQMYNECLLLKPTDFPFRPISDIRCPEFVASKRPVTYAPRSPKGSPQQWAVTDVGSTQGN